MRLLSILVTFRCTTSDTRSPAACAVIGMVRCLRLAIAPKKVVISSRLRMTGSRTGFLGKGKSSSLQSRLSVTR
ncbi:hypothetical protein LMG29542_08687 [Paraburkholderia humisilvae]|uniref:Uncharacterized protein n=1 Tax=Paraburkholderia humisilvae TaxID=627669 RepID=A0A6J5FDJ9_9BURK|nr:hypothetical protein LMG29542_08687 [Paraburkholderia humisilvae]